MRRSLSLVAAALLGLCAAPADAYRADRADGVVAVLADGTSAFSSVTARGARYLVAVTGAFAYDRLGGLADCGYHDTNAAVAGQQWSPGSYGLRLDGDPAPCGSYSPAHAYTFEVTGTGSRLAFSIADPSGHGDNAGALQVSIVTLADVDASCEWHLALSPGAAEADLVVAVEARHTGAAGLGGTLHTECQVLVGGQLRAIAEKEAPVPFVADAVVVTVIPALPIVSCLTATLRDANGATLVHRDFGCSG